MLEQEEHDDYTNPSESSPLLLRNSPDGAEIIVRTQSTDIDVDNYCEAAGGGAAAAAVTTGLGTRSGDGNGNGTTTENNNAMFIIKSRSSFCFVLCVLVVVTIVLIASSSVDFAFSFHHHHHHHHHHHSGVEDDDYDNDMVRISNKQIVASLSAAEQQQRHHHHHRSSSRSGEDKDNDRIRNESFFPNDFIWGTATSSYQVEGAVHEGHRGVSIWDTFCKEEEEDQDQEDLDDDDDDDDGDHRRHIVDGSNGDVTCDHYHRFRDDVLLLKRLNIKAYRFSIAWTRIFPSGKRGGKERGPNLHGIEFYNERIDELLLHGIEPWVTLYHWDLPQALEDEYGGWLNPRIVDDFGEYAATCFDAYGDRVKHWITLNESWTVAVQAYEDGTKAPGLTDNPPVNVYRAGHHLLLAHARAVSIYRSGRIPSHKSDGRIGIANCGDFRYPKNSLSSEDHDAAERAMVFQFGWLTDPLVFGDYPQEMKDRVGDRLPKFTVEQKEELVGTLDFVGLNHYSTLYAAAKRTEGKEDQPVYGGYWHDMDVEFSSDPSWRKNYMGWSTNPDGCRELLVWISRRYPGLQIAMTENGTSEDEPSLDIAIHDEGRRQYFESYLRACGEAIQIGVPLNAYFAWSLMDNFEWEYGYTRRFGICYVDFETLQRTPKSSALWYRDTIELNGSNLLESI